MPFGPTYGSEAGWISGEASARDAMARALDFQQRGENLQYSRQMDPLLIQQQQMANREKQIKLWQQERFAQLASGQVSDQMANSASPSERMARYIDWSEQSGDFVTATKLLPKYSEMLKNEATQRHQQVAADTAELKRQMARNEMIVRNLNGVHDQSSWLAAIDDMERDYLQTAKTPEEIDQIHEYADKFRSVPYSENTVRQMQDKVMSVTNNLKQRQKELEDAEKKKNDESLRTFRTLEEEHWKNQDRERKRTNDFKEKHGGEKVKEVTQAQIDQVASLIREQVPNLKDKTHEDQVSIAAATIASRANKMIAETPGLDPDQARRRALKESIQAGEFMNLTKPDFLSQFGVGKGTREPKFEPDLGKKADNPIPMSKIAKESDLVKGDYYKNDKGQVGRWNGKTFELVGEGRRAEPVEVEKDNDDDSDDDSED